MEYRKLGGSDLNVSVIGFGAWGIGGHPFWSNEGDDASRQAIRHAFDQGVNFFDTAPVYGFGHSEKLLGEALAPVRGQVIIATKCGLRWKREELGGIYRDCSKASIREEVELSLQRLRTDRIDLYQVHWPDVNTPQQETMDALRALQKEGKIRHIGVSNYSVEQMQECLRAGRIESLQPEYSLVARGIEKTTVPFCLERRIGIIAYSPLASGVLTGKYDKKTRFTDWRSKGILGQFTGKGFADNIAKVDQLKKIAQAAGKTCGQMALNWLIQQPGMASALAGVKNAAQMTENAQAAGWQMTAEQRAHIDGIFRAA